MTKITDARLLAAMAATGYDPDAPRTESVAELTNERGPDINRLRELTGHDCIERDPTPLSGISFGKPEPKPTSDTTAFRQAIQQFGSADEKRTDDFAASLVIAMADAFPAFADAFEASTKDRFDFDCAEIADLIEPLVAAHVGDQYQGASSELLGAILAKCVMLVHSLDGAA